MKVALLPLAFALTVLAGSLSADEPPTPVETDINVLRQRIMAKANAGQRNAEALAGEIGEFDTLMAKYAGQAEAQASILAYRAHMMRIVLKDGAAAHVLYQAVLKDYPGTQAAENVKRLLYLLSPEGKAEAEAKRAETKAKHDALMSGMAPDFVVQSFADGREVKLSDYRGKVVVLDFWASWCGPCKASMPHNQEVAAAYKDQDVVIFAVCVWDEHSKAAAWLKENQPHYPDLHWAFDPAGRSDDNTAKRLYAVNGIPAQFIIGRDGRMIDSITGYRPGEKILEGALAKAGIKIDDAILAQAGMDLKMRGGSK